MKFEQLVRHVLFQNRVAVPYQYSALNQFDNDPEDEVNDLENNLDMLVEDSTSDEEEISAPPETGSKTVGAIDFTPADANAVKPVFNSGIRIRADFTVDYFFSRQPCQSVSQSLRQ